MDFLQVFDGHGGADAARAAARELPAALLGLPPLDSGGGDRAGELEAAFLDFDARLREEESLRLDEQGYPKLPSFCCTLFGRLRTATTDSRD